MNVRRDSGGVALAYLRFDLSGIAVGDVTDASLSLFRDALFAGNSGLISVWGLNDGHPGEDWVESGSTGITWNTAPALNQGTATVESAEASLLGSFQVDAANEGDEHTFDLPSLVTFLNQDTNGIVTLILERDLSEGAQLIRFASKENTTIDPPTLTITTADPVDPDPPVIPLPAAVWGGLVLMGVMGGRRLVRRRRGD